MDQSGSREGAAAAAAPGLRPAGTLGLAAGSLLFVAAGLLGAAASWAVLEKAYPYFEMSPETAKLLEAQHGYTAEEGVRIVAELQWLKYSNQTIGIGVFGLCMGGMLSLAEGAASRSFARSAIGLLLGLVLGAFFGGLGGMAGTYAFDWISVDVPRFQMYPSVISDAVAWGIAGLGVGAAVALTSLRLHLVPRCTAAAMLAGVLLGLLHGPISALVFPMVNSETIVPDTSADRIFGMAMGAVLLGLLVAWSGRRSEPLAT